MGKLSVGSGVWEVDWAYSSWSFPLLAATYLWKHVGYDMVLWLAGLQGISHELYEAARMDGAGGFARLWYVTLPGLRGSFRLVGILSLVDAFRVYREAYLLAGEKKLVVAGVIEKGEEVLLLPVNEGEMEMLAVEVQGRMGAKEKVEGMMNGM